MKKLLVILTMGLAADFCQAAVVTVTNMNNAGDGAFSLFSQSGTLVPGTTTDNLRLGYFSIPDSSVQSLWASGNLTALGSNFVQYGSSFGMQDFGAGFNGVFQGGPTDNSDPFVGKTMTLWASTGSNFLSTSSEYLIFRFDETFQPELWVGGQVLLGTSSGMLLVGAFGNFSYDYGLGSGTLPGYNTVATVPEPATGVLAGLGALWLFWRTGKRRFLPLG